MADENEVVTVGEVLTTSINMRDGFLWLWVRSEVLTVTDDGYTSTYTDWAVLDSRRGDARDARPVIAGFTPLPYKAITLSAGFCGLPLIPFVLCSLLSRGARFFLVAGLLRLWGGQVKYFIDRYFNQLVVLFVALIVISLWFLR